MPNFLSDAIDFSGAGLIYNPYGDEARFNGGMFGGVLSDVSSGGKSETPGYTQAPEYPEASAARQKWWSTLQGWNADNNYGAISPDWSNIWDMAKRRIQDYYQGTSTGPGAYSRLKNTLAGSNMIDSGAFGELNSRLLAEEGRQYSDLASEQAVKKAEFGETSRLNYLSQLGALAGYKPTILSPIQEEDEENPLISLLGMGIGMLPSMWQNNQTNDLLKKVLQNKSSAVNTYNI